MQRLLPVTPFVVLVFGSIACGDDTKKADTTTTSPDVEDADTTPDAEPEVVAPSCEASITEVDKSFVEIVAKGDCADWSIAIRDGAVAGCSLAAEVFFPRTEARAALEGFQVPASAVIILQDRKLRSVAVWTVGTCEPDASCLGFIGEEETRPDRQECLPADTATGSVSLCGAQWVADKPLTPGAENNCECLVDCAKAAASCQSGRCVDGACAFEPRDEGLGCDDRNLCTSGDTCRAGSCAGDAVQCDPPDGSCEEPGQCSPTTGQCVYVDVCGDNAVCNAGGCQCEPGFTGDPLAGCVDVDECATGAAQCDPIATCVDADGDYLCVCPIGYASNGQTCTPSTCACPWEDAATCGPELRRLRVRVADLWGQPINGASLRLLDGPSGQVIRAEDLGGFEIEEPLCASRDFELAVEAADHHRFEGAINWRENDITMTSLPSKDAAWAITWDAAGPVVWVGLAHRWFASSGRPARHGNDVRLMLDGEEAWGTVFNDIHFAQQLITGATWWWTSEIELVRPEGHVYMDAGTRWHNTVLGALEDVAQVEKKVMVGQFLSQDGILENTTVDDELLAHAEQAGDDFEYMGMANLVSGVFQVTPPSIDFATWVLQHNAGAGDLIDEAPADPWHAPITVDMTELPLGLGVFDLPLASWHQKFWTMDQTVAFIGGMNAKTSDWDGSEHLVFDARRMEFDADVEDREAVVAREEEPDFPPRKDYMVRMEGPMVQDAVDVFADRWHYQLDEGVDYSNKATPLLADPTSASFPGGVQAQVVATMPDPFDENAILETVMRAVSQAKHMIYIEDQYFRAPFVYDAIVARMTEVPDLFLVVLTNEVSEWTDPGCFQTAIAYQRFKSLFRDRFRMYRLRAFDYVRTDCTFCWDETEAHFVNFDLHSKIVIIDDEYLQVGSCNSNNRGYLYEGELAVAVHDRAWVARERKRIFENLLGPGYNGDMPFRDVIAAFDERANANGRAYALWDDEGMDLDLDGDAVRGDMIPSGFVYPMSVDVPDECLIEGVGPDIT